MTTWKLAVLVGAATAVAVTGVALSLDRDHPSDGGRAAGATLVADQSGRDGGVAGGPRDAMQELMQDPDFREELWALQGEQQKAMRAWWDEHGDDPASDGARDALEELRDTQRAAMSALLEKYGAEGLGRDGDGSAALELMGNDDFRADLWAFQDAAAKAVQSWWDEYGDDPASDQARDALKDLHDDQRAELEALLQKYGVDPDDLGHMGRGGPLGSGLLGLRGGLFGAPMGGGPDGHGRGGEDGFPGPRFDDEATGTGSTTTLTL